MRGKRTWTAVAAVALLLASCGYNLVGRGGQFPAGVEKVAVPIFANETKNPEIARRLTNSFIEELLATGKVMVVDPDEAQAVIQGTVTRFAVVPITFDSDRKTTENRMEVFTDVSLFLAGETEPLFEQKGVSRYFEYPVPEDLALQQKEEDIAYRDISRELSQTIISIMTVGF